MNRNFIEKAQENIKIATWSCDTTLLHFEFSKAFSDMFGLQETQTHNIEEFFESIFYKDVEYVVQLFEETASYGIPFNVDFRSEVNGKIRYFTLHCDVAYEANEMISLYGTVQDITQKSIVYNKMKKYTELIEKYIITSQTDIRGNITYVSQAFSDISGYTKEELMGQNHRLVRHPDMQESLFSDLWTTIKNGSVWQGEVKNLRKDGGYYWVLATISPMYDEKDEIIGYQAVRQDITDKKYVQQIAITDALTSLYNRRYFNEVTPTEIDRAKKNRDTLVFTMMDVDNFKKYNDTYGHQKGDAVLIDIASTLQNSFKRAEDLVFRLGGEEFGVLFKVENEAEVFEIVDKARQNIQDLAMEHSKNPAGVVTASFGVVKINLDTDSDVEEIVEFIYKEADTALYDAKEGGRNRVSIKNYATTV